MTWTIEVTEKAEEKIEKYDIRERVQEKLLEVQKKINEFSNADPDHYFRHIKKFGTHRLRVGDYRIFADINRKEEEIHILTVASREDLYDGQNPV